MCKTEDEHERAMRVMKDVHRALRRGDEPPADLVEAAANWVAKAGGGPPQKDENGRPFTKLSDQLKAWERKLSPAQMREALERMRALGWGPLTDPPEYVWAQVYLAVDPGLGKGDGG